MLFNSLDFLLFFPVVTLLYFVIPVRFRHLWLLAASYYFYMCWSPRYALLMLFSTAVTWLGGRLIVRAGRLSDEKKRRRNRKSALIFSLVANLAVLCVFKYLHFIFDNIVYAISLFGGTFTPPKIDLLLPVGISFYTFQALGYTIDVYRGDIDAEPNFLRYALFVSFFPQLVAGPIERSGSLLRQLRTEQRFDGARVRAGLVRMGWGLFMKMVIADRLAYFVDTVYNAPEGQSGSAVLLASLFFMFQVYCDFGGYSNIAIGAAQVMGVKLMTNFHGPFLATSVRDFWRRWHISLSSWFRDYVYFPLGGSRKGKWRSMLNTMIVFLLSGLWHGAAWHYVFWGGMHGLFLNIGRLTLPARKKLRAVLHIREDGTLHRAMSLCVTFVLLAATYVLFRANTMHDIGVLFRAMFCDFRLSALAGEGLFALGLDRADFTVALAALGVLIVCDVLAEKRDQVEALERQALPLRWTAYLLLAFTIIIFGIYGPKYESAAFIYFAF